MEGWSCSRMERPGDERTWEVRSETLKQAAAFRRKNDSRRVARPGIRFEVRRRGLISRATKKQVSWRPWGRSGRDRRRREKEEGEEEKETFASTVRKGLAKVIRMLGPAEGLADAHENELQRFKVSPRGLALSFPSWGCGRARSARPFGRQVVSR